MSDGWMSRWKKKTRGSPRLAALHSKTSRGDKQSGWTEAWGMGGSGAHRSCGLCKAEHGLKAVDGWGSAHGPGSNARLDFSQSRRHPIAIWSQSSPTLQSSPLPPSSRKLSLWGNNPALVQIRTHQTPDIRTWTWERWKRSAGA